MDDWKWRINIAIHESIYLKLVKSVFFWSHIIKSSKFGSSKWRIQDFGKVFLIMNFRNLIFSNYPMQRCRNLKILYCKNILVSVRWLRTIRNFYLAELSGGYIIDYFWCCCVRSVNRNLKKYIPNSKWRMKSSYCFYNLIQTRILTLIPITDFHMIFSISH